MSVCCVSDSQCFSVPSSGTLFPKLYPILGRTHARLYLSLQIYAEASECMPSALTFSPNSKLIDTQPDCFPPEYQRAIWNAKLSSSFLLLPPDSQPCFCSSVFALVWNSTSPGIHRDYFLYSRLLRKCYLN